jgi:hypothetical protein
VPATDDPVRTRRLVLVERAPDAGAPAPDTDVLVLDASFTPRPRGRTDLIPVRPALARVLDRVNLFDGSTDLLDRWAAAVAAPERFRIGDMTWWFRVRLTARWPIHEVMLWHAVLKELRVRDQYASVEVPAEHVALVTAVRLVCGGASSPVEVVARVRQPAGQPAWRRVAGIHRRVSRAVRRRARSAILIVTRRPPPPTRRELAALEIARRERILDERVKALLARPHGLLVVATGGFFQLVHSEHGERFVDPHLAPVADRASERGIPVATLGLQLDHRRDADWRLIESQPTLVPQSLLATRWKQAEPTTSQSAAAPTAASTSTPGPKAAPAAAPAAGPATGPAAAPAPSPFAELDEFLAQDRTVIDLDGDDFGPVIRSVLLAEYGSSYLAGQARTADRAERLVADLRPSVMLLDHEGGRTAYLAGAHRRRIPVVAVQHGIIFDGNAEYVHPLDPLLVRQDLTCVYGAFEHAVLTGPGGFPPHAVVTTGSSRVGPILVSTGPSDTERAAVREEFGVHEGDRMLVVSLGHNPVAGDLHTVNMVARTLGGPLPGVHIVLKLHPQEHSDSRYAALLEGLAVAGGYAPPRMSVVRDFDLYRLLRGADAHLGQYSTMLTDAVVANVPNMIAVGYAWSDLLGYVDAGVAVPVRSVDDVRTFMRDPQPANLDARARFLEAHFLPGDATGRILGVLGGFLGEGE